MTDKSSIYNATPKPGKQTSTKTITMGDTEHIVVTPQDFQRSQRDFIQMQRQIQQLQSEVSSLRNQVRALANKPAPKTISPWGPSGGPGGY